MFEFKCENCIHSRVCSVQDLFFSDNFLKIKEEILNVGFPDFTRFELSCYEFISRDEKIEADKVVKG